MNAKLQKVRIIFVATFLLFSFSAFSQSSQKPYERQWSQIENIRPRFGTRDLFHFALEATADKWHPERVEKALELASQKQDRNPKSKTYGNFAWYWEDKAPDDRNCVEFCMQKGILLWILFKDKLTPRAQELLLEMIHYSTNGIKLHNVQPSYSNIYLKKIWNCIAIGEYTGNPDFANIGYEMLQTWLKFTRTNGISEYLSPTYYAVDMENIGLISRYAKNPAAREKAAISMQYIWTEIAANWFPPAERLGGAHSRDYDYLFGRGGLDDWVVRAGWSNHKKPAESFFNTAVWVAPPQHLRSEILDKYPRMVRQRWGSAPYQIASQWIGEKIAIGTAGAAYLDAMDKTFVVLFEGSNLPTCSFLMDARLDPYGNKKYVTGGGHLKSHHVFPFLASVQRNNEALLVASAAAGSRAFQRSGTNLTCWLSHWVVPSELPLYIGNSDNPAQIETNLKLPSLDTPIFLRKGNMIAGFRFVYGTTPDNKDATLEIVNDGKKFGARRITCVHSLNPPQGRATVATYVRVGDNLNETQIKEFKNIFSKIKPNITVEKDNLDISINGLISTLRLKLDLNKEKHLLIEGEEPEAKNALLMVNSKELGIPLLDKAITIEFK